MNDRKMRYVQGCSILKLKKNRLTLTILFRFFDYCIILNPEIFAKISTKTKKKKKFELELLAEIVIVKYLHNKILRTRATKWLNNGRKHHITNKYRRWL